MAMDKNEFVKRVAEIITSLYRKEGDRYDIYDTCLHGEKATEDDYLREKWVTGGQRGGSCWGDDADLPVEADAEPEFSDLDRVLEDVCPKITFLQYKSVVAGVVMNGSREAREYYGNYTTYGMKVVRLGDLYETLQEKGLLS
jgi:hypothetical protein